MTPDWTPWAPLDPPISLTARGLTELVDGGQAFRWWRQPDGTYHGQWSTHVAALRLAPPPPYRSAALQPALFQSSAPAAHPDVGGVLHPDSSPHQTVSTPPDTPTSLEWSAPAASAPELASQLPHYLGYTPAQTDALNQLPWRSDAHLARCIEAFPDLRILHQPFGETLLAFLCSATKQIVQIKQMLALLAEHHGSPLPFSVSAFQPFSFSKNALPSWAQLAKIPEAELRACQLGFRAKYIAGTAQFLAAHPGWLDETAALPYIEAKARLLTLPGVGEKIADCVLLFGAGQLAAFPVDTWMIKAMARRYQLTDWSPNQVAHFGRTHFGPAAGLAQQYLFAWERAHGKANR